MQYIGLDIHQHKAVLCILGSNGKKVRERVVRGGWEELAAALREVPRPWQIVFEASTGAGVLYDRLRPLAARVVVAHPGKLRLIFAAKRKHDRVDAAKLATLLFLDQVPPAYMPGPQVRAWRGLLEYRQSLVHKRTRTKNQLRALWRGCGIGRPAGAGRRNEGGSAGPRKGFWAKQGLAVLRQVELPTTADGLRRDLLLDELEQFNAQVQRVERELDRLAQGQAGVALLQSIPGVGPRTAEAVLAYIDDARRFGRIKRIGAYFGLVPCQDQSADTNRLGHITKEGPATVRHLLVEASWQAIRHSPSLRRFYQRVRQDKKERTKLALVALAHHLARVMLAMLHTGEAWREAEVAEPAPAGPVAEAPTPAGAGA